MATSKKHNVKCAIKFDRAVEVMVKFESLNE